MKNLKKNFQKKGKKKSLVYFKRAYKINESKISLFSKNLKKNNLKNFGKSKNSIFFEKSEKDFLFKKKRSLKNKKFLIKEKNRSISSFSGFHEKLISSFNTRKRNEN